MGDDGKPGEGAPSGPPALPQLESYAVSIIIIIIIIIRIIIILIISIIIIIIKRKRKDVFEDKLHRNMVDTRLTRQVVGLPLN